MQLPRLCGQLRLLRTLTTDVALLCIGDPSFGWAPSRDSQAQIPVLATVPINRTIVLSSVNVVPIQLVVARFWQTLTRHINWASTNINTASLSINNNMAMIVINVAMAVLQHPDTAIQLLSIFNNTQAQKNVPPTEWGNFYFPCLNLTHMILHPATSWFPWKCVVVEGSTHKKEKEKGGRAKLSITCTGNSQNCRSGHLPPLWSVGMNVPINPSTVMILNWTTL